MSMAMVAAVAMTGFAWPEGKKAAVSLTYDDGIQSQLDNAGPALDKAGLKGTFFLPCGNWLVTSKPEAWAALSKNGHELASHTMTHPCSKTFSFVKEGQALEDYDEPRITKELDDTLAILAKLTGTAGPFSFAYPCGNDFYGPDKKSYVPLLKTRFTSARSGGNPPGDPMTLDLYQVPSYVTSEKDTGASLISFVERSMASGGWAVFMIHGVGGDYITVSNPAHQELLEYLAKSKKDLWVTPFGTAANWVAKAQKAAK